MPSLSSAWTLAQQLPLSRLATAAKRALLVFAWPLLLIIKLPLLTLAVAAAWTVNTFVGAWMLAAAVAAPVVLGALWSRVHARSWAPIRARLLGSIRGPLLYRWRWRRLCLACGLTKKNKADGDEEAAQLVRVRVGPSGDELLVHLRPGMIPADFERRADDLAHALSAREVRVSSPKPGRVLLTVSRRDPLAEPLTLTSVRPAMDLTRVPFAIGEDGRWRTRNFANVSAEVGGGVPGSGKTAGETSLACALIQNPAVQYVVIDGKGGSDWTWITRRASIFCREDEDFHAVAAPIERVYQVMRHRLRTQKSERGSANFWNLPLDPAYPVVVVIVDEVQTFTETKGMPKDQADTARVITARLTAMVKKGRSAGIVVKPMTQKPTADALPTAIRDNASIRTSWRVMSRQSAEAVLGPIVNESTISPVDIPQSQPGVAVVGTDRGELERVRYPYVTETTAETIAHATAHLRRDLDTPTVSADELTPDGHEPPPPAPALGDLHPVPDTADEAREAVA